LIAPRASVTSAIIGLPSTAPVSVSTRREGRRPARSFRVTLGATKGREQPVPKAASMTKVVSAKIAGAWSHSTRSTWARATSATDSRAVRRRVEPGRRNGDTSRNTSAEAVSLRAYRDSRLDQDVAPALGHRPASAFAHARTSVWNHSRSRILLAVTLTLVSPFSAR